MQKMDLGTWLCRLGGADAGVLKLAPKARREYVALALVLLSTASIAVVSMTFAMADGLKANWVVAIAVGLFWGFVILTIDRALIISLKPKGGKWRLFWMIIPRVVMAALLGFVISIPLTLRIFADEIQGQMTRDQIATAHAAAQELKSGDLTRELEEKEQAVRDQQAILDGNFTFTSPELALARQEHADAQAAYDAKQREAETAYRKWQCELYGVGCEGTSERQGNGPLAQALEQEYNNRRAEAAGLKEILDAKTASLRAAEEANATAMSDRRAEAEAAARTELAILIPERDRLRAQYEELAARAHGERQDGLLAQLIALEHLGAGNGLARVAHLLLAGLFFMIELLPVAIKTLSAMGPSSVYDKADRIDDAKALRLATERSTQDLDSQQRIRKRAKESEERVVDRVHGRVEAVVTEIALDAVEVWAEGARKSAAVQIQQPPPTNQDQAPWHPYPAPQQPGPYNLPPTGNPAQGGRAQGNQPPPPNGSGASGNGNPSHGGNP